MSEVITDRAQALVIEDDSEPVAASLLPVSKAAPPRSGDRIACSWCGSFSAPGPGCDSCGSPLAG